MTIGNSTASPTTSNCLQIKCSMETLRLRRGPSSSPRLDRPQGLLLTQGTRPSHHVVQDVEAPHGRAPGPGTRVPVACGVSPRLGDLTQPSASSICNRHSPHTVTGKSKLASVVHWDSAR